MTVKDDPEFEKKHTEWTQLSTNKNKMKTKAFILASVATFAPASILSAAVYDISTNTTVIFNSASDTITNTGGLTTWATTGLKFDESSNLSNVNFSTLGVTTWDANLPNSAATMVWDGANLSGLTLNFTGNNKFRDDSLVGVNFSGATIATNGNQPFVDTGSLNLNNANFVGTTFQPSFNGSLGFTTYAGSQTILAGADFSDSVWQSPVSSGADLMRTFNMGPGTTSVADAMNAANFSGANFSGLSTAAQGYVITNLGKFDGSIAIGAFYDNDTLSNSGWDAATLNAAGWQAIPEPSSCALFGLGIVGLAARRRR